MKESFSNQKLIIGKIDQIFINSENFNNSKNKN